jgi:hypothetical protein
VPVDVEHHQTIWFHPVALFGDPAVRLGILRARLDQHSDGNCWAAVQTTMAMHQEATVRIERVRKFVDSAQVLRCRKDQARLWADDVVESDVQMSLAVSGHVADQDADDVRRPLAGEEPHGLIVSRDPQGRNCDPPIELSLTQS